MKMTFRWYGSQMDPIPLRYIKQIPNMSGVVTSLMDMPAGALWPEERIRALKQEVNDAGLEMEVIESVNVHEDIKLGLPSRDRYIEAYQETVRRLGRAGVKVICYNFMPVFDWTRSDLFKPRADGATVLAYDQAVINRITDPQAFADRIQQGAGEFEMAGWEPERMAEIKSLFAQYASVSHQDLRDNLAYFLKAVIPVCEEYDVKMAIHPDDPPWDIFGLPRIYTNRDDIRKILAMVDSPYNCLTLCSGSLGSNPDNDIPALVREFGAQGRIPFAHVRNIKFTGPGQFEEAAHFSADGSLDLYEIMKAYYDVGMEFYIRPDHGRMIWDEKGRAGYGLFDRALGGTYLHGLWEAIQNDHQYLGAARRAGVKAACRTRPFFAQKTGGITMDAISKRISEIGVVPVIKLNHPNEDAAPLAKALCAGGVPVAEVTFRAAGAAQAIRLMTEACPEMLVGAGTVLTTDQVDQALEAGAKFIVTPGLDPDIVTYCQSKGVPVFPGCTTPTDYHTANKLGLEVLKFFPAEQSGGLAKIKAMSAPFPMFKIMPTGGISLKNLREYLSSPVVCACGGSYMVTADLIDNHKWDEITALCQQSVAIVREVRNG